MLNPNRPDSRDPLALLASNRLVLLNLPRACDISSDLHLPGMCASFAGYLLLLLVLAQLC